MRIIALDKIISYIVIAIIVVVIFILITRYNRNQMRRIMETHEKDPGLNPVIHNAIETNATVISRNETIAPNAGGFAKVDLQLELQLAGQAPYLVSTSWLVKLESLDQVLPGMQVPVKVDPKKNIRITPNVSWATTWIFGN
jgi:hypothetical protein